MNKPKLNQPDVEKTATDINLETQTIIANQYPRKKIEMVDGKFVGIPAPTEEDIFKEFENLGYECVFSNNKKHLVLMKNVKKDKYDGDYSKIISINSITKNYSCYIDESYSFDDITLKEHQLLHRLFEIWGWVDE